MYIIRRRRSQYGHCKFRYLWIDINDTNTKLLTLCNSLKTLALIICNKKCINSSRLKRLSSPHSRTVKYMCSYNKRDFLKASIKLHSCHTTVVFHAHSHRPGTKGYLAHISTYTHAYTHTNARTLRSRILVDMRRVSCLP